MQSNSAICSLCGSQGTNKSTCPLNSSIPASRANAAKHNMAKSTVRAAKKQTSVRKSKKSQTGGSGKQMTVEDYIKSNLLQGVDEDHYMEVAKRAIENIVDNSPLINKELVLDGTDGSAILLGYIFKYNVDDNHVTILLSGNYNALNPARGVELIRNMEINPKNFIDYDRILDALYD